MCGPAVALPRPCEADRQTRDYVKDTLSRTLPLELWDRLDTIALSLSVTGHRLQRATGSDRPVTGHRSGHG
ncbi:hypothetical protein [Streptomyces neyagawaensis]|uniref:Transposase n=1 Tax=Streptomyces neyagawaensis TaxID=42238 RepID=A0ABV3BAH6_9ACTN